MIAEHGPLTAAAFASHLGLTPAAVCRHLGLLAEQDAIEECEPATAGAAGRGRPARAYIQSEAGHAGMGSDYDDVATSALRFLAEHAGADAVGEDVTARAKAPATTLTADGFAASTGPVGDGTALAAVQLRQGHCPVQHVCTTFIPMSAVPMKALSGTTTSNEGFTQ